MGCVYHPRQGSRRGLGLQGRGSRRGMRNGRRLGWLGRMRLRDGFGRGGEDSGPIDAVAEQGFFQAAQAGTQLDDLLFEIAARGGVHCRSLYITGRCISSDISVQTLLSPAWARSWLERSTAHEEPYSGGQQCDIAVEMPEDRRIFPTLEGWNVRR